MMSCCLNGWREVYLRGYPTLVACTCEAGLVRVLQGVKTFEQVNAEEPPPRPRNATVRARAIYGWRRVALALGIEEPEWMKGEPEEAPPSKRTPKSSASHAVGGFIEDAYAPESIVDDTVQDAPPKTKPPAAPSPKAPSPSGATSAPLKVARTYRTKPKPNVNPPSVQ